MVASLRLVASMPCCRRPERGAVITRVEDDTRWLQKAWLRATQHLLHALAAGRRRAAANVTADAWVCARDLRS